MARGTWVDSAQDATVLGGSAGCRAWVQPLKSRPHHVPLSLTGAKTPCCGLAQNLTPMSLSHLFA
jgi:hypothetical protein